MPSKSIVQIYEIQSEQQAELMINLDVDHIGTVLMDEKDWKNDTIRNTVRAVQDADCRSSLIPLFSRSELVLDALDFYRPDIVHFCESLTDGSAVSKMCNQLVGLQQKVKAQFPSIAIMRSVPIAPPGQADLVPTLELARRFEAVSDYFLTDTLIVSSAAQTAKDQPVAGFIGITGQTCDWDMASALVESSEIPVILAGGINPDNAADAYRIVRPAGLDSCTGTNACDSDGVPIRFQKDPAKVRQLVEIVRKMENT